MKILTIIILISGLYLMDQQVESETRNNEPGSMTIMKSPDFEITGNGQASEWNNTKWEVIPQRNNNESVNYSTRVRILYSETGIYFLFDCGDKVINSTLQADNLKLWEEDVVEVFLMPDEKYPLYFEYQLSPLNYELTILIPNLDGNFLGWLPWQYEGERKTRHETSIVKDSNGSVEGWIAEFFIPWKLLTPLITDPPKKGDTWKANMYRLDYDKGMTRFSWQKTDINFHEPHNFGTFIFE
ncbi:MAG: carbohydrate-binding family 9-like protein [Bacteroidales bacterium]